MFPEGIITRELEVGPAFDLVSGAPYGIRVMVSPTRAVVWGETNDPVIPKLKTYTFASNTVGSIELPVTDQEGWKTTHGEDIVLDSGENAFGYTLEIFYLLGSSVAKKANKKVVVLPEGDGSPLDIDTLITFTDDNSGSIIAVPDEWSSQVAAAEAAAAAAAASAATAEQAVEELEGNIGIAVEDWFATNTDAVVSPETLEDALQEHREEPTPHKAYDLDMPSLTVLFENGLV